MHTLDRTQEPNFQISEDFILPPLQTYSLNKGLELQYIDACTSDVIGIEMIFHAGKNYQFKKALAFMHAKLFTEGTQNKTAKELHALLDFYGASINIDQGATFSSINIYTHNKFLRQILQLVVELLEQPNFTQEELEIHRSRAIQKLMVDKKKSSYVATQTFKQHIFGASHPIGYTLDEEHINAISAEDILKYHQIFFQSNYFEIFAAGNINEDSLEVIKEELAVLSISKKTPIAPFKDFEFTGIKQDSVKVEGSTQKSLRIGRLLFRKQHPDFIKLMVTNVLFGGYFGSRLMQNIREEKGLTYGINSSVSALRDFGYMLIGANVAQDKYQLAIDEIYREMQILQNEPVSEDELERVKNYICGRHLSKLSTAFSVIATHKELNTNALPPNFYNQYISKIMSVTVDDVQNMAQKYLRKECMIEVSAG